MLRGFRLLPLLLLCSALARSATAAPPTVTVGSPAPGDPVRLSAGVAGTFTGTAPVTVKLKVDSGTAVDATVVNMGYFGTVTLPNAGPHTITVTATNAEDSATATVDVIGDDTGPTLNVSAPANDFKTGDA